jgi:hypothetical protein
LEKREKELALELAQVKQTRIESFNKFESGLGEDLPELGLKIGSRLEEIEVKLELLHQEIRTEAETLRNRIDKEQEQRQGGIRSIQEMISRLT